MYPNRFANKHVLITGASSGIGLAGARRIAEEGGTVIATGLDPDRVAAAATGLPAGSVVLRNDASDPQAVAALVQVASQTGGLDGLWLNAGFADLGAPETITAGAFDRMMHANVRGPMLQLASLSPWLKPGAAVLLTSSTSAYEGAAATSLYAATKAAQIAVARSWATALAARDIRVNVLVPGPIDTRLRDFLDDDARSTFDEAVVAQVPLRRMGTADEAAAVALFLLSDEASFVTGSQYPVDGGMLML